MLFNPLLYKKGKKASVSFGAGLLGGGKYAPITTLTTSVIEADPYQYYAPQIQFAPQTSYAYQGATTIISSPEAVVKKQQTMDLVSRPEQVGAWEFPIDVSQEPDVSGAVSGTNMTMIALIAVAGAAAIMLIGKKKK